MPQRIKLTQFFSAGKSGWSETWYKQAENPDACLAAADLLNQARVVLLANDLTAPSLDAYRLSDDERFGDALVRAGPGKNNVDKLAKSADVPWTGWLVRVEAGSQYRRMFIVRGCPDLDFALELPAGSQAGFKAKFAKYFDVLKAQGWGLKVWDKDQNTVPEVKVLTVVAAGGLVTMTAPGLNTVPGDDVFVRGFVKSTGLNGTKRCVQAKPDGCIFQQTTEVIPVLLNGREKVRKRVRAFAAPTDFDVLRAAHHDTGRPFDSPRGRQRK